MEIGIDPVIFAIGSFEVRWYGIMVALAALTGVAVTAWLAKKEGLGGLTHNQVLATAVWAIPGGIIGARLIHVFDEWSKFSSNPGEIVGGAGLGIFGAILGGTLAGVIYARIHGLPIGRLCDFSAFGLLTAQAIGRIGCFLNGCCHGKPTDLSWGVMWTHTDAEVNSVFAGQYLHPTQIYELIFDLLVFAFLWVMRKRIRLPGMLYLIYISTYSVGRFLISFLRTNEDAFWGLQQAQVVSLVVLIVAIGLIIYNYHRSISGSESTMSGNTKIP